ncbi:MAG TPA: peptide ABC transporter permease [Chloroflexi bacterium]|nr:peptide ABC transporter permease [Chloroflexota bacterium]
METTPEYDVIKLQEEFRTSPLKPSQLVWKRFLQHKMAVFGAIMLVVLIIYSFGLSIFFPESEANFTDTSIRLSAPSAEHPFGTDTVGRDIMKRTIYGGQISLLIGLSAVIVEVVVGVMIGAIAGYYGGWIDNLLMRIIDATLALPSLLVLILLGAVLREVKVDFIEKNTVVTIAIALGLLSWMTVARLVRAIFLALRDMEYVQAARALGASNARIILQEILPNGVGPIIVESTLGIGFAIMEESGLSFLGFGIRPPTPSWGNLLSNAQEHFTKYPWLAVFPGLMIFLSIISVNYIGDGLRDALDPQGRRDGG